LKGFILDLILPGSCDLVLTAFDKKLIHKVHKKEVSWCVAWKKMLRKNPKLPLQ
jgi:hypothetical protein